MRLRPVLALLAVAGVGVVPTTAALASPAPTPTAPPTSGPTLQLAPGVRTPVGVPLRSGADAAKLARELQAQGGTTKTRTITRTVLESGTSKVVDRRTVRVTVGSTQGLRDRQGIDVAWTGAHPTGAVVGDPNSALAAQGEYPVVLLQCRGIDSTKAPKANRLTPQTCWTQTSSERFTSDYNSALPPWRLDRYAAAGDRQALVNRPKNLPVLCSDTGLAEHWLPFVAASGKTYPSGPSGCGATAPEAVPFTSNLSLPGNTTYATSSKSGRGATTFNVRSSDSNASLGCNETVDCALVVVPIMGISCDADASGIPASDRPSPAEVTQAGDLCKQKGVYAPGELYSQYKVSDAAVRGTLWWSASNWRNRFVFPMTFAESAAACSITGGRTGVTMFGSELMNQAFEQWSPEFCLDDRRTPVQQVQTGEPQARSLLKNGSIEAALSTQPQVDGYGRPVVHAPVAATGFSIAYQIDGANGQPMRSLRLTPRLLAKLLTESYPAVVAVQSGYVALQGNPLNLTSDPEFLALNPGVPEGSTIPTAATLLSLSSDSDVLYALTSYIDADPAARAWLDGKPDPWGMVVNPKYKGIELPVYSWPVLDEYQPTTLYQPGINDCLYQNPVPYLPLVAAPLTRLSYISLAMQFAIAQAMLNCYLPSFQAGSTEGAKLVPIGRQTPGYRFMIGITSLADAERFGLPTAALQTQVDGKAPDKFTSPAGRTFVAPGRASLQAAAQLLEANQATKNWDFDYSRLQSGSAAKQAYPGLMVVYADVPTEGLAKDDAAAYADWMEYVVTDGQQPGSDIGQLPQGYLPLTAANALGDLSDYTRRAAVAVRAQNGSVPSLQATGGNDPGGNNPGGNNPGGNNPGGYPPPTGTVDPGTQPAGPTDSGQGPPAAGDDTTPTAASLGKTLFDAAGMVGFVLPGVLLLAMVAGVAASAVLFRSKLRNDS